MTVHPELTERELAQMLKTWGGLNEQARSLFGKDFADDFAAALVVSEQQQKRLRAERRDDRERIRMLNTEIERLRALSPSTPEENK